MLPMDKKTAIELLGGTTKSAMTAMGIQSYQAIYAWEDPLTPAMADRVVGALVRIALAEMKKASPPSTQKDDDGAGGTPLPIAPCECCHCRAVEGAFTK